MSVCLVQLRSAQRLKLHYVAFLYLRLEFQRINRFHWPCEDFGFSVIFAKCKPFKWINLVCMDVMEEFGCLWYKAP